MINSIMSVTVTNRSKNTFIMKPVPKLSSQECSSAILESLSQQGRFGLNFSQSPLTHKCTAKGLNEEVVTYDYRIYYEEWLGMRCKRRGLVTTTCSGGANISVLSDTLLPKD